MLASAELVGVFAVRAVVFFGRARAAGGERRDGHGGEQRKREGGLMSLHAAQTCTERAGDYPSVRYTIVFNRRMRRRLPAAIGRSALYLRAMASVWVDPSKVREFADAKSFYAWLRKHRETEKEVWIKIHKVRSGLPSITPAEAIDAALCWGWIDGIRKSFDDRSFLQRYTPRGKKSVWSQVNVANVARLIATKKMQRAGLAHVEAAKADGRWNAAYRIKSSEAPSDLLAAIRASPKARAMYETLSAQNRFALTFRTLAMKTEAGRTKKIATFVAMLERGETIHPNGSGARRSAAST